MMLKSNFENCEKVVPTQIPTQTFEFKFGMKGLRWHSKKVVDKVLLMFKKKLNTHTYFDGFEN